MKEQNESYRHLREQLDQHEFELPPSSWAQMADILDGKQAVPKPQPVPEEQERRGLWWLLFVGLMMVSGYLGAQYLMWDPAPSAGVGALPIPLVPQAKADKEPAVKAEPPASSAEPQAAESSEQPASEHPTPVAATPNGAGEKAVFSASPQKPVKNNNGASQLPPARQRSPLAAKQPESSTPKQLATQPADNKQPNTTRLAHRTTPLPTVTVKELEPPTAALAGEPAKPVKQPALRFGLKAGLDGQIRQTTGLIGLFARYRLSGKWALQLEPQYKFRSDNFGRGLELNASTERTGFFPSVAQSSQQKVSITRLHFWELPLTALYQAHPRWQLLGGVQVVHLRNSSQKTTTDELASADNMTYTVERNKQSQSSPAILRWDAGLILGVDYQLGPALSMDLRYVQGLYDLTYDAYFIEDGNYLNSSLQLSVKWKW